MPHIFRAVEKEVSKVDFWTSLDSKISAMKCPFLRHKTYTMFDFAHSFVDKRDELASTVQNDTERLSVDDVAQRVLVDWIGKSGSYNGGGYYVTGNLDCGIYQNDCVFIGPDADLPIKGFRRYQQTAAQLFDQSGTRADLLRPLFVYRHLQQIKAYWRIEGTLHLPWHPKLKGWTGSTTYHINPATGRICRHVETWDISLLDAYASALFPCLPIGKKAVPVTPEMLSGENNRIVFIE